MPIVLPDTATLIVDQTVVRGPLHQYGQSLRTQLSIPEPQPSEEADGIPVHGPIKAQVLRVTKKNTVSQYRQDLLTSQE